jgi:Domain of unknown function (DUF4430)
MTKTRIYIGMCVAMTVALGLFVYASRLEAPRVEVKPVVSQVQVKKPIASSHVTVTIPGESRRILLAPSQALYDALIVSKRDGTLSFSGIEYPGLGFFVTDIGTLHQGRGKYLIYYVNGVEASTGVSAYVPHDGDVIEWKLK